MRTAAESAARVLAAYEEMNRLLPLAGGIPRPVEQSDDDAVILARGYQRAAAEAERMTALVVGCHRRFCTAENCDLDGGPEHATAFGPTT